MRRRVVWTTSAQNDLNQIARYLGENTPEHADSIFDRLVAAGERLGAAQTGRPARVVGHYEKSVAGIRYIIVYSVERRHTDAPVNIVRIIHTSRDWRAGRWPD